MKIEIAKGGKLIGREWVFDPSEGQGRYVEKDITSLAPSFLFRDCSIGDDVSLTDIFLLVDQHMKTFSVVLNNWVEEFAAECFQYGERDDGLAYLELYWHIESDGQETYGLLRPCFHGIDKEGEAWGISGVSIRNYADLPVRLNDTLTISVRESGSPTVQTFEKAQFSLGQILEGIVWEISYYGSPAKRDATWDMIRKEMADALEEMDTLD